MDIHVRGECSRCGVLIHYEDYASGIADLFLTVPGRGYFAKTFWEAELIHVNAQMCADNGYSVKLDRESE